MVFDQLKKIAELKKLQAGFKDEKITVEKRGVAIIMNGNLEVEEIKLNPELSIEEQQNALKDCMNEAKEEIQKRLAKQMLASGIGF